MPTGIRTYKNASNSYAAMFWICVPWWSWCGLGSKEISSQRWDFPDIFFRCASPRKSKDLFWWRPGQGAGSARSGHEASFRQVETEADPSMVGKTWENHLSIYYSISINGGRCSEMFQPWSWHRKINVDNVGLRYPQIYMGVVVPCCAVSGASRASCECLNMEAPFKSSELPLMLIPHSI